MESTLQNLELGNFVSLLGLAAILFIAWAMSYHRTKVKLKPIALGLGLQAVLAMIILTDDSRSYVGIGILASILVVYILREQKHGEGLVNHVIHLAMGLVLGAGLYFAGTAGLPLGILSLVIIAVMVANRWIKNGHIPTYGGMALIVSGSAYLMVNQINGRTVFNSFSEKVKYFLSLADYGSEFLFGFNYFKQSNEFFPGFSYQFAFSVLPTIIFFGGFMAVMYYLGIVQVVISAMSKFMRWTIGTSGSESLSCSANIFVGQTEAPLLVKPYLNEMTQSELLTIMVGGFATIAGGVLAGYIQFGVNPGHLIAASVMSAPAALVIAKIIFPETEKSKTSGDVEMPQVPVGDNILDAASGGIADGLKLALNVGAMLIGFIALIAVIDVVLNWADAIIDGKLLGGELVQYRAKGSSPAVQEYAGFFPGSLQTLFGTVLKPLAWLMGVPWEDADLVANLLGVKLSLNEFVAFGTLGNYINNGDLSERAAIISTYALCGFANFSSVGIQIGGLSALAPERRSDLAKVGLKAMFGGAFASWTTACIAGVFI